jgi:hypothetical protein
MNQGYGPALSRGSIRIHWPDMIMSGLAVMTASMRVRREPYCIDWDN